jgi:signal transduction histidine kinase
MTAPLDAFEAGQSRNERMATRAVVKPLGEALGLADFAEVLTLSQHAARWRNRWLLGRLAEEALEISFAPIAHAHAPAEALLGPVALGEAIREAAGLLRLTAAERCLRLEVDAPAGRLLRGDRRRLVQVFTNPIGDAVKFTDEGGVVRVSLRREGDMLSAVVADTGVGIPADRPEDVFRPFVQVDGGHSRSHGGVGLGLALARRFVERRGGAIGVESTVGVGTRMTVAPPAG